MSSAAASESDTEARSRSRRHSRLDPVVSAVCIVRPQHQICVLPVVVIVPIDSTKSRELLSVDNLSQQGMLLHGNPTEPSYVQGCAIVAVVVHAVGHCEVRSLHSTLARSVVHLFVKVAEILVNTLIEKS